MTGRGKVFGDAEQTSFLLSRPCAMSLLAQVVERLTQVDVRFEAVDLILLSCMPAALTTFGISNNC